MFSSGKANQLPGFERATSVQDILREYLAQIC